MSNHLKMALSITNQSQMAANKWSIIGAECPDHLRTHPAHSAEVWLVAAPVEGVEL